jgi:putative ABC transport system ATP-binding protein
MALLEARDITKTYTVDHRAITVLENVSLSAEKGEFIVIAGSSGSGKTTLLTLLSGLDHPTSGQVFIDDREITHASEEDLAPLRNRTIGFVFQSFHLVPSMTARENIMFPAELAGDPDAEARAGRCCHGWACRSRPTTCPASCPGAKSSALPCAAP